MHSHQALLQYAPFTAHADMHRPAVLTNRCCCCRGLPSAALAILAAVWSSLVASRILVTKSPGLEEQRSILAYPCLLIYGSFALLTAY